jgi:hypothetical protein
MTLAASFTMGFSTGERDQQYRFTVTPVEELDSGLATDADDCHMDGRSGRGMGRARALYSWPKDGNNSPWKEMTEGGRAMRATQGNRGRRAVMRLSPNHMQRRLLILRVQRSHRARTGALGLRPYQETCLESRPDTLEDGSTKVAVSPPTGASK